MAKPNEKPNFKKSKQKKPGSKPTLTLWFETHYSKLCISVLVVAGVLRLMLLFELPNMPINELYKNPDLDMNFFDKWGDRVANGDIMTDTIWHPYHTWHREITNTLGLDEAASKAKWDIWYGGKKYHQEPLYPLLIGIAKSIAGNGHLLMYILQMLLGLVSIWMLMWLGKYYFGAMAGILGGLLFTLYSPNLLFDAVLLRTSLSTFLMLVLLFYAEKLYMGKGKPFLFGILGGVGYLLMTTSILVWLPLTIRWVYLQRGALKNVWKIAAGFCLIISLLVIRNSMVGSPPFSASSVGPVTYVLSNFPNYEPEFGFAFFVDAGRVMDASGGQMIPAALGVIQMHESFWDWVILQFKKFGAVFHWYEISNNINTYLAAEMSLPLRLAFIPYSVIAALGMMGLFLNLKNSKTLTLHIGILSQVAIMVIFYVLCRFRVPMVAILAIFAGYSLQQIFEWKTMKSVAIAGIGSIAMFLVIIRPFPKIPVLFDRGDLATYFQVYYLPRLDNLSPKGDLAGCAVLMQEIVNTIPDRFTKIHSANDLSSQKEKDLASLYSKLAFDLSDLYKDTGNTREANNNAALGEKLKAVEK